MRHISADLRLVRVKMVLRWYNRNYVHAVRRIAVFHGRSVLRADAHGEPRADYIVWDKAANIEFVSPGRGAVYADFSISQQLLDEIRMRTAEGSKYLPRMHVEVRDGDGTLVARVQKTLYIRLKPRAGRDN